MKKIILLIGIFSIITLYGQDNIFPTTGNVGIGTLNPLAKLHIFNGDNSYGAILANSSESEFSLYTKTISTTQPANWESFRIGLKYNEDERNGYISFYRGPSTYGGCLSFSSNGAERMRIDPSGNIGIGTVSPQSRLDVVGTSSFSGNMKVDAKLEAKEIKVTTTPTADFVFGDDYRLPKLEEVEKHIKEKKHLPEIASATEMEKEGVNVGEFQIKLLQKIEELTLYTIEQNKQNKLQEEQIKIQQEQIKQLEVQNKELLDLKKMFQELKAKTNH